MARSRLRVFALLILSALGGLAIGCFREGAIPNSPDGDGTRPHVKPTGWGLFADSGHHRGKLEVRPMECMAPVRGEKLLIATVLDEEGKPHGRRRVEWTLDGPGTIVEVDETGSLAGRGSKIDSKYAVSFTDTSGHTVTRGNDDPKDDFTVQTGQTWCIITSAVEGLTTVTAFAPTIANRDDGRVYVKTQWVDARGVSHLPRPCERGPNLP